MRTGMITCKTNRTLVGKTYNKNAILIWLVPILMLLLVACAPKIKTSVLNFFFDGVPANRKKDSAAITSIVATDSLKQNTKIAAQQELPGLYYHKPYKERACTKCHSTELPGKITSSQDEICYSCHTDFRKKYNFVHGPVAGGFCTTCHAPHFSEQKHLLQRIGQELCFKCHVREQVMSGKTHVDIGDTDCTGCHNPHGGNDHFILKELTP